ncbi:DUF397 domain-containing protein [Streptomyces bohaiensis]|uniref:DUF397 domain-containing protein n=1 Tax=Streptomyces bohaiensis TaxID=1431344 RepID=A0ABX1C8K9_9ACTN|nr:DUF397 domain-containing protein [Streptomyces bohaiensis]NJQ15413.1 DUF397 domain-containing protein [Streptomyces bohaiensis]
MTNQTNTQYEWVRSSYSTSNGGECLEFQRGAAVVGSVPVRDSKITDGPVLTFSPAPWAAFVAATRIGSIGPDRAISG